MTCRRMLAVVLALACVGALVTGCAPPSPPAKPNAPPRSKPAPWTVPAGWVSSAVTTEGLRVTFAAPATATLGRDWDAVIVLTNVSADATTLPYGFRKDVYVREGGGGLSIGDLYRLRRRSFRQTGQAIDIAPGASAVTTMTVSGESTRAWKPTYRKVKATIAFPVGERAPSGPPPALSRTPPQWVVLPEVTVTWLESGAS